MKILMPATHYYPVIGGIETWTKNIAERLAKSAEVFLVTGRVKGCPKKETATGVKIWRTSPFVLSNLSASPLIYSLSLLPFVFFKSLSIVKKEKIDIIHCQGFLSSFLGFSLAKITGVPYIVTVQRLEKKNNPFKNFIYRQAAFCIAASLAVKKNFEDIGVKRIEIIPNGIDLARFKGSARQRTGQFTVIAVARLEKVKGLEYLIQAVSDFQLIIVGGGSEKKNLENLVEKLNKKEEVRFLGEVPNTAIPGYLAQADCFCLPSLKEGFGIVVLEAQAAGLPVVATRVGGILDLIEDRKTGLLVEPQNSQALNKAILEIKTNPELARRLADNAKANLIKYEWDNIAEKVYQIYQAAI
jgi:glycosyltransferase involved in cell wall biosynthesis